MQQVNLQKAESYLQSFHVIIGQQTCLNQMIKQ